MTTTRSSLALRKFVPNGNTFRKCFNMVVLGHKHTGKSTLMHDMLYWLHTHHKYPRCVVFSGTEEGNDFYTSCIPKPYIHHGMDIEKLKSIIDVQRRMVGSVKEAADRLGRDALGDVDLRLVIVLDDLMYKRGMTRLELFSELFMNGRHWQVSIVLSCQYIMSLDTACRANVDYLFVLREMIPKNRIKIYDNFFGMFEKKNEFFHVLDSCTQNYECLVLDATQPNTEVERCIFWYKADINLPNFMFGSRAALDWAKRTPKVS